MGRGARSLISTQYARNGPLLEESQQFTRLVSAGVARDARREVLLVENALGRPTHKTRRSIFEALEQRFADERRARHLGILSTVPGQARNFGMGVLLEIARHDELVGEFLAFIGARVGQPWSLIDAQRFLEELDGRDAAVRSWAPSIQKRAVSSLNSISSHFQLWRSRVGARVAPIELPNELVAIIAFERLLDGEPVIYAPEFAMLGVRREAIVEALWSCARRGWYAVDTIGDVVHVEPKVDSIRAMFDPSVFAGVLS